MAKKRNAGEGSIFQRSDGRWCAQFDCGWQDGRRVRKYIYGVTAAEVQDALLKARHDHARGLPVVGERQTVGQFLADWLENTVKPSVRPRTYQSYELLVRLHVLPELAKVALSKLQPQRVQALLEHKRKSGLAPQTVRHVRTVLKRALTQAVKWNLVARNAATLVDPPRLERQAVQPPNEEQIKAILAAARGERSEPLLLLAATLGCRRGEILGLRWQDVDLDAARVAILQAIQRYKGKGLVAAEPKTKRSRRVLSLPQAVVKALRAHRVRQLQHRLVAGSAWRDSGLVFTSTIGTPLDPRKLHREFKRILAKAGLPETVRFHDLRHAAASYLLSQGVPLRTIADLLGHSGIAVTSDIYSHVAPQMLEEAALKMDVLVGEAKSVTTAFPTAVAVKLGCDTAQPVLAGSKSP